MLFQAMFVQHLVLFLQFDFYKNPETQKEIKYYMWTNYEPKFI